MLNKVGVFLIAALLLTSFFCFQDVNAAYTPDLGVIRVSPYNYDEFDIYDFPKYQPGYRVEIGNYGSAVSPETNMTFYIKTFDNKTLKKTIKVPSIRPGYKRSVKFSMCAKTDGSFKEGYAVVNPSKSFQEISYKNNIRKITLKDVILKSSNKTVTETGLVPSNLTWSGSTSNYTSPISGKTGITKMYCKIDSDFRWNSIGYIKAPIPGYLHDNVTMKAYGNTIKQGKPTSWDENSCTFNVNTYFSTFNYAEITVTGENLENEIVFREPIQIMKQYWDPYGQQWAYTDIAEGKTRNVQETYIGYSGNIAVYTVSDVSSYKVHSQNVTKLTVTGDPRELYVAGWFITPKGSISGVNALYGNNKLPGTAMANGRYGISKRIRGYDSIGWEIQGNDIKGFKNFRSLGFSSWTWKETYV